METTRITVMTNAAGSWALLGRFDDTPGIRRDLDESCARLHWLSDRHTHFKLVDAKGQTIATLCNGSRCFEPTGGN
jgi:hypothetical protein